MTFRCFAYFLGVV